MYTPQEYLKGIVNAQFTLTHMAVTYWTNYMSGMMDTYEQIVRQYNGMEQKSTQTKRKRK